MKRKRIFGKICRFLLAFLVLFSLFSLSCSAQTEKTAVEELEEKWEEMLPDGMPSGVGEGGAEELAGALGFSHLLESAIASLRGKRGEVGALCMTLLGTAALLAAGEAMPIDGRLSSEITAGIGCVAGLAVTRVLTGAFAGISTGIGEITSFFSGVLPMFSAVLCAGGSTLTAGVQNAGMNLSLALIGRLNETLLLPLSSALLAFASIGGLDAEGKCTRLSERIYRFFLFFLGILSSVLLATLSLQSTISSAKDSSAIRAAKTAAGLLPAVGSTLSGSLSVLSSGVSYLKSAVGVSTVSALLGMAIAPLAELVLYRLSFFLSGVFLAAVGAKNGEKLFSAFRYALDAMTAVYVFSVTVCLLEAVIFLKSGVGIA